MGKLSDDHNKKVGELNNAHGNTVGAKDKIIEDLTRKLKEQGDEDGQKIDELTLELARIKKKNQGLQKRVTILEEELDALKKENEDLRNREMPKTDQDDVKALRRELKDAHDYILELEDKVQRANKNSRKFLKQIHDAEAEIDRLNLILVDHKGGFAPLEA